MTVRKFLRFFKHFGYYMRKDFRWLKWKLRERKNNKLSRKAHRAFEKKTKITIERFNKLLNNMYSKAITINGSDKKFKVDIGNNVYIPFKDKKKYCKFFVENGNIVVVMPNKTEKFECEHFGDLTWKDLVSKKFECSNLDSEKFDGKAYYFMIKFKELSNKTIVRDSNFEDSSCIKIYQTYGKQPKRLTYTINWNVNEEGMYCVTIKKSRDSEVWSFYTKTNPNEFVY